MTNRERFLAVMNFEKPDKFPIMEFMGFWPEVQHAWQHQGLPAGADIFDHFNLVKHQMAPVDFNFVPPFEEKILEETQHHLIVIDVVGCKKKIIKNSSAMPHYIEFPIKKRSDFESLKERLDPTDHKRRYPADWDKLVKEYAVRDYPLGMIIRGPFAFCRDFVKFEELMVLVYDDYQLIRDMMNFQADFIIKLWDKALSEVDFDYLYFGEDMAFKTGPMFSPAMFKDLVAPLYKKITDFCFSHGVPVLILDSDGCIKDLLPIFVNNGLNCVLPVERAAGNNPLEIRRLYPKLRMIGGVDKLKIADGGESIDSEIEMVKQLAATGGYIPSFDHSVPPIVSYQNYKLYNKKLNEALNP